MKVKSKKIKRLVILALALMLAAVGVFISIKLLTPKIGFTEKQDDIFYFPEDYSEDIFEDLVYVNRNRDVKFDYYGTAIYMNEENIDVQSTEAKFFYNYFQTVINGDYTAYREYFDESFFLRHSIPEKFTKQKLYDIEVSAITSDIENGAAYETYKVSYKIQENNGSFRADVSSTECKPVAITVKKGKVLKITSVIPIL